MSDLVLHSYDDPQRFERDVEGFLLESEAANGLPLGLLSGLRAGEWEAPYLAAVTRGPRPGHPLALVAMRTPPYALVLCVPADAAALELLADDLHRALGTQGLPGVLGPEPAAGAFAEMWSARRACEAELSMSQRIYRCSAATSVGGVPGMLRPATGADRPLTRAWLQAFHDASHPREPFDAEKAADRWLRSTARSLWYWEDRGEPVAMVGASGPTPNGIRISAVYTPPERRRRGYASAAVADLTQRLLDEGRAFCTLFTDLSNPTSNKIYRGVGYQPVLDVAMYGFADAASD